MPKTIFIHGGANAKGKKIIRELLNENDYTNNIIKNEVICADTPESVYKMKEFLGVDEFTFLALTPDAPIDINKNISQFIIINQRQARQK